MSRKQKTIGTPWVLVSETGLFPDARGSGLRATLTSEIRDTYVYDARDNRAHKARFFSALFGMNFTVRELPAKPDASWNRKSDGGAMGMIRL